MRGYRDRKEKKDLKKKRGGGEYNITGLPNSNRITPLPSRDWAIKPGKQTTSRKKRGY